MPRKPRYLLCPPDHFRVDYAINPWMGGTVDPDVAERQWLELEAAIQSAGAGVTTIAPHPDLPDMVFTANAGAIKDKAVVLSNFRHAERQGETDEFEVWFNSAGYRVHRLPRLMNFEGCGDVEFVHSDIMIGGFGFRSDLPAHAEAAQFLGATDLITVELVDNRFYHLDTCFLYLGGPKRKALYWPHAFNPRDLPALAAVVDLVPISENDALQFVCNSIVIGDTIIMPENTADVTQLLLSWGWNVVMVKADEFMKAGGSLRCLSLDINK